MPLTKALETAPAKPHSPALRRHLPVLLCQMVVLAWVLRALALQAAALRVHVALPFQVDYEEGNILNALLRISHGFTPYPDPHAIPNVLNPYGPAAYYLLALPVKLLGVSFLWPRLIIVAGVAAVCLFIALTIFRLTRSPLTALLFGALYATIPVVAAWSAVLRVDFLALAFATAGVYVFCLGLATESKALPIADCQASDSSGSRSASAIGNRQSKIENDFVLSSSVVSLLFSAALFVAALFVKYTYLAAPAACLLWLLEQKQWKRAAWFAGSAAVLSAVLMLVAVAATRGAVLTHLFLTHADPFSLSVYLLRMTSIVAMCRILAALAAVCLVRDLWRRSLSVPSLWLLLAAAAAVTAGKLGSNWNHFLEFPAALCLSAGLGWYTLTALQPRAFALASTIAAAAGLTLFLVFPPTFSFDPYQEVEQCPQAYQFIRQQSSDRILSENVGALVLAGKTVWLSNPFVYSQQVMRGGWPDGLEPMLRQRTFDWIAASRDYAGYPFYRQQGAERFSPAAVRALAENYRSVQHFRCRDAAVILERK